MKKFNVTLFYEHSGEEFNKIVEADNFYIYDDGFLYFFVGSQEEKNKRTVCMINKNYVIIIEEVSE